MFSLSKAAVLVLASVFFVGARALRNGSTDIEHVSSDETILGEKRAQAQPSPGVLFSSRRAAIERLREQLDEVRLKNAHLEMNFFQSLVDAARKKDADIGKQWQQFKSQFSEQQQLGSESKKTTKIDTKHNPVKLEELVYARPFPWRPPGDGFRFGDFPEPIEPDKDFVESLFEKKLNGKS